MTKRFYLRFLYAENRCARGFRNLPHTSVGRFRKCGEKPKSADQALVLSSGDLRFCCQKLGCARRFSVFPALPKNTLKPRVPKRKTAGYLFSPKWGPCFAKPNSASKLKRGPTHQPSSGVARRLPPQLSVSSR